MKIRIDLHVHTNHSVCALLKPEQIESIALKKGLGCVAVTDHNTIDGALKVRAAAKSVKIIVGEEIKTSRGEITGYFLKEKIPPYLLPEETIKEIKKQGGLVSIPHPFDMMRSSRISRQSLESVINEIDMIEIFNSRDIWKKTDEKLLEKVFACGAAAIVSSDAHMKMEVGRSYMIMEEFEGPEEFLQNIKKAQSTARKSPFRVHIATKILKAFKKAKKMGAK